MRHRPGPQLASPPSALLLATAQAPTRTRRRQGAGRSEEGKTAGIRVIQPEKRDIRMTVVQPGTIQAFEVTPIYSRIAGYVAEVPVQHRRPGQGGRRPDRDVDSRSGRAGLAEAAEVKRADVQIRVTESSPCGRRGQAARRPRRGSRRPRRASSGRRPATRAGSRSTSGSSSSSPSASSTCRCATRRIASSRRPSRRATRPNAHGLRGESGARPGGRRPRPRPR